MTVDGQVTSADGYTVIKSMNYTVEKAPGIYTGATMWLYQDAGSHDVFAALTLPTWLVDNSYGTTGSVGWGAAAPSGKDHKFQELTGSDNAQFVFRNAGGIVFDVTVDYFEGTGHHGENPPYNTAAEFSVATGLTTDVLAGSSAMVYNWVTFGEDYPGYFGKDANSPWAHLDYSHSDPAGWAYDVTYEFQIAGSVFGEAVDLTRMDFVSIPVIHASPNKIGGNKLENFTVETFEATQNDVVPEPVTMLGTLMGVAGLGGYLRRRK